LRIAFEQTKKKTKGGTNKMSKVILGIQLEQRIETATSVQSILTEYGCFITTRIGLHQTAEDSCSEKGLIILELADQIGIHIPRLCYDHELSSYGGCRLCVVEVDGMSNLQASCVTPVRPGMVVNTHSPRVMEARREILGLLLADHPQDCMTCDKMGNCDLADYCYEYGVKKSLFDGTKPIYPLDDSNPFILRDRNKCILCGKCVRACSEIPGINNLDFAFRSSPPKLPQQVIFPILNLIAHFAAPVWRFVRPGHWWKNRCMGWSGVGKCKRLKPPAPFAGPGVISICW
jgi:formate dehydrogenase alpha subunit